MRALRTPRGARWHARRLPGRWRKGPAYIDSRAGGKRGVCAGDARRRPYALAAGPVKNIA